MRFTEYPTIDMMSVEAKWRIYVSVSYVIINSGNVVPPIGTKPLHFPMMAYCEIDLNMGI